jgi:hypothetical protein
MLDSRPLFVSVAIVALALAMPALAHDYGPPDGFANDPPDYFNCASCHAGEAAPSAPSDPSAPRTGLLELLDLPDTYVPGTTYPLRVRLSDTTQQVWGFELTVIDNTIPDYYFDDGGTLQVTDPSHTQISIDSIGSKDYLKQTLEGSYHGIPGGPVTWELAWTAPEVSTTSVTFYMAANAGNGDGTTVGDHVYLLAETRYPTQPTLVETSSWGRIKELYK